MQDSTRPNCQCPCGASKFTLNQAPKARFFCHCKICQEVYRKPYSDAIVVRANSVTISQDTLITYKNYWSSLQRGICPECHHPVVGFLTVMPFVKVAFIPAVVLGKEFRIPEAKAHIFYHRHVHPVNDSIPKASGFIRSELKAAPIIFSGLRSRRA